MATINHVLRKIMIAPIRLYRYALSPLIGSHCRFSPSCSHFAIEAIDRFGILKGGWLTLKRLGRCHPWHEGGADPVPPQTTLK